MGELFIDIVSCGERRCGDVNRPTEVPQVVYAVYCYYGIMGY
jgi:hypothetical protein